MVKEVQYYSKLSDATIDKIFIGFLALGLGVGLYTAGTMDISLDPMFIVLCGILASLAILCTLIALLVLPMDFVYIWRRLSVWLKEEENTQQSEEVNKASGD